MSGKACGAPNCEGRHYAKGFCKKHWTQQMRHGKLMPDRERGQVRVCKVEGCERTDTVSWHCRKHARQLKVHGKLTPDREHVMGVERCAIPKCKNDHRAKGFCAKHYNQARWLAQKAARPPKVPKPKKAKAS